MIRSGTQVRTDEFVRGVRFERRGFVRGSMAAHVLPVRARFSVRGRACSRTQHRAASFAQFGSISFTLRPHVQFPFVSILLFNRLHLTTTTMPCYFRSWSCNLGAKLTDISYARNLFASCKLHSQFGFVCSTCT